MTQLFRITTQKVNPDGTPGEVVDIVEFESDRECPSAWQLWQDYQSCPVEAELWEIEEEFLAADGGPMNVEPVNWMDIKAEVIADLLLVVDVHVPLAKIEQWTVTQRVAAANWAAATHLLASDNVLNEYCRAHDEDQEYDPPFRCICRPPVPECLVGYGPERHDRAEKSGTVFDLGAKQ